MKKLLLLIISVILGVETYAQYMPTEMCSEVSLQQIDVCSETSAEGQYCIKRSGLKSYNAGKALMFTGASVALAGIASYLYLELVTEPDPARPTMGTSVLYPMLAIPGAAIALIGVPFYFIGKGKMKEAGISAIKIGDDTQRGGVGIIEIGGGIPALLSMDVVGGYNLNRHIFLGGGLALNMDLTQKVNSILASVPIYANARFSFGSKMVSPYIGVNIGYDLKMTDFYSGLDFGTRFRCKNSKKGASWWLAANTDFVGYGQELFLSVKVGRSF